MRRTRSDTSILSIDDCWKQSSESAFKKPCLLASEKTSTDAATKTIDIPHEEVVVKNNDDLVFCPLDKKVMVDPVLFIDKEMNLRISIETASNNNNSLFDIVYVIRKNYEEIRSVVQRLNEMKESTEDSSILKDIEYYETTNQKIHRFLESVQTALRTGMFGNIRGPCSLLIKKANAILRSRRVSPSDVKEANVFINAFNEFI
jgi:hypothetical protein